MNQYIGRTQLLLQYVPRYRERVTVGGGEVMVELLSEIESLRERAAEMREELGLPSDAEAYESLVRFVYANLAIEDSTVTLEEVREVLSRNIGE
jgi:chaperonin GroEL (HSP60 family)